MKFEQIQILLILLIVGLNNGYESVFDISSFGYEFVPADSFYPPVSIFSSKKLLYCSIVCTQRQDCRTFDYNEETKECRVWDVDLMTSGSIVLSFSKNRSSVGSVRFFESIYSKIYNESCDRCIQNRYTICNSNTSRCQCPPKTYWNGSICLSQLLYNQICSSNEVCRSDLNLSCEPSCDMNYRCIHQADIGIGETVAGFCNGSAGGNSIGLTSPWAIYISPCDGTLYVTSSSPAKVQAYPRFSRTGYLFRSSGLQNVFSISGDSSNTIYMADRIANNGAIFMQRGSVDMGSIPVSGISANSCSLNGIYHPVGVAVDRFGDVYLGMAECCIVMKWSLNATNGTIFAGQMGNGQITSDLLVSPSFIYLDEDRNALYVTDRNSNRIQKFIIGGNGTGMTVAGNGTAGGELNQLNSPRGIWVSPDGQRLYIADAFNTRIMKWTIGDNQGSILIDNTNLTNGNSNSLLNNPIHVALDPTETFVYIVDNGNHRVQRFRIR